MKQVKIEPGTRAVLPELCDLLRREVPGRPDVYRLIAEVFGCTPSLVQQYTLGEKKRRRHAEAKPVISP